MCFREALFGTTIKFDWKIATLLASCGADLLLADAALCFCCHYVSILDLPLKRVRKMFVKRIRLGWCF